MNVLMFAGGIFGILFGLFSLFMLVFNGGIGETFYNYSFFFSSVLLISAGVCSLSKSSKMSARYASIFSILFCLPVIYMNFTAFSYIALPAIAYDIICIIVALAIMLGTAIPNHPLKRDEETAGLRE